MRCDAARNHHQATLLRTSACPPPPLFPARSVESFTWEDMPNNDTSALIPAAWPRILSQARPILTHELRLRACAVPLFHLAVP
jgi:hypothetical protein